MKEESEREIEVISGDELKALRELSFEDILKMQIVACLRVGNNRPNDFYISVSLLERLLKSELDESYWDNVKEIEKQAMKMFPMWQSNADQALDMKNFIAMEKFSLLMSHIERKIPKEIEGVL